VTDPSHHRGAGGADVGRACWSELQRTAALLRAGAPAVADSHGHNTGSSGSTGAARTDGHSPLLRTARRIALVCGTTLAAAVAAFAGQHELAARADATANQDLFALTNQDRASNGLPALQYHTTLAAIAENKPYGGCGFTVNGRSQDMIQRNYFSHPILNCGGQLVFSMMSAAGINYRIAGENIGWASGAGDAAASASYINQQFMNSPEHRSNILQSSFTHVGMGSILSAPGQTWTGASPGQHDVWMFSEEFAGLSSAPPPPAPAPKPKPTPAPPSGGTAGSTAAPVAPPTAAPTPAATELPTATPAPTPAPTPTPVPAPELGPPQPPLLFSGGGLIADSIQAVLEAFLID
jgi:uncharacterized protein YkwD